MKRGGTITPATRVEEYRRQSDGDFSWRVKSSANGQVMAGPGEGFQRRRDSRTNLWGVIEGILAWCFERNPARTEAMIVRIRTAVVPPTEA